MKKINLFLSSLALLLVLASFSYAGSVSIYSHIKKIDENPRSYIIVVPAEPSKSEIKAADTFSKLSENLHVFKRDEIGFSLNHNLIKITESETNQILLSGTNLEIAGSSSKLNTLARILVDYKDNQDFLSTNKFEPTKDQFSPLSNAYLMNIIYAALALSLVAGIIIFISHRSVQLQVDHPELIDYAQKAIQRGFSKKQITQALIDAGWKKRMVNHELKKVP